MPTASAENKGASVSSQFKNAAVLAVFDPAVVRAMFEGMPADTPEERFQRDGFANRVVSFTLMHQRFGVVA